MHAFMVEGLDQPELGPQYSRRSTGRAWTAMAASLAEVLGEGDPA